MLNAKAGDSSGKESNELTEIDCEGQTEGATGHKDKQSLVNPVVAAKAG